MRLLRPSAARYPARLRTTCESNRNSPTPVGTSVVVNPLHASHSIMITNHLASPLVRLVHRIVHREPSRGRTPRGKTMASHSVRPVPIQNNRVEFRSTWTQLSQSPTLRPTHGRSVIAFFLISITFALHSTLTAAGTTPRLPTPTAHTPRQHHDTARSYPPESRCTHDAPPPAPDDPDSPPIDRNVHYHVSRRKRTTSSVPWRDIRAWATEEVHDSPDLAAIVQVPNTMLSPDSRSPCKPHTSPPYQQ